jgi:hypothetical protein
MMRRTTRSLAGALLLGVVSLVAALGVGSTAAVAEDTGDRPGDDGIGISVTVTPAPVPAPSATAVVPPSGSRSSTTPRTPADPVAPAGPVAELADDEVDLGGILYVSGLSSTYRWSPNPLEGAAETRLTVRNVSKSTFTSTVRFWADGPVGNRLSEVADVEVADLKPGEVRTVEASLGGIGQSTLVQVHATLTPPKVVDGVELDPVTRDQSVVIPPWGVAALGGLGAVGFAGFSLVQFLRRPVVPLGLGGVPA